MKNSIACFSSQSNWSSDEIDVSLKGLLISGLKPSTFTLVNLLCNFCIGLILVKPLQFLIIPIIIGIAQVNTVQKCAKVIKPVSSSLMPYSFPAVIFIKTSMGICIKVKTKT